MAPCFAGNGGLVKSWNYTTTDSLATVLAAGYFNGESLSLGIGDIIDVAIVDAIPSGSRTVLTEAVALTVFSNSGGIVTTRLKAATNSMVRLYDDFEGDVIADQWGNATKGSDGATADFAILADVNGKVRGTTGAGAGGTMAANGIQIHRALNWKANQGGLSFEARIQTSAITNISYFVGFTDQIAALEAPITSAASANTITTNATDAVGFMFDTSMTTANIWLVGVANDVDATAQNSAIAPVAATYITLRVEVTSAGVASFFINNVAVGTAMAGAVTATVALTPVVAVFTRTAASATMDIDYISVQALRA
jgi:hypothetical protein